jgi:hypothetical protein
MEKAKLTVCLIWLMVSFACAAKTERSVQEKPKTINLAEDETEDRKKVLDSPRSIKISVTISRREDLRVSVGDKLSAGDVIADRTRERNALLAQKSQAEKSLERLYALQKLKNDNLQKPILPDASFAEHEAAIRRAQILVDAAKRNIGLQEIRLKQIENLPFPADLSKVREHEKAKLELLKNELLQTESSLALEKGKLITAKANRAYAEQKDALEIQKSITLRNEQRINLETQITQIETQVINLDSQILLLSAVRAPFAGVVKKISWEGQTNAEINVVISVDVDDDSNLRAKR